jgi:outer membrane lipoprotein-sorting protein
MAANKELSYLKNNYSVAYSVGPDPVPLEEGSDEMVIKLKFQSLSSNEGFTQLEIAFDRQQMIRRVTGVSGAKTLVMDYQDIRINQEIPDARFAYEAPANANVFRNFLFEVIE